MSNRKPDKVLFAYIAIALYALSLVLIRIDCGVQRPVYYVSKSLHEAEVLGTRKLPHYFQAHTVVVLTQLPLKTILQSVDYTGRVARWGTILGAFDIKYMPRTSIPTSHNWTWVLFTSMLWFSLNHLFLIYLITQPKNLQNKTPKIPIEIIIVLIQSIIPANLPKIPKIKKLHFYAY